MRSVYRGLIFWCLGAVIFWSIEAIVDFLKRTLSSFSWHLFIIGGMYLVLGAMGAFIFWAIYSKLPKYAKDKLDSDCFFIATFTFSTVFIYSFLWVNVKNPDTFFSLKSILIDFSLLFLCFIFSAVIYFEFTKLKRIRNLIASFIAYSISLDFFIVFVPYFNWQIYRESVWTLERFLTFKTFLSNIFIFVGCILLYILIYNCAVFLIRNFRVKSYIKTACVVSLILVAIISIILPLKHNSIKKQLALKSSFNSQEQPNVLIFLMDTLRAGHLGSYGYLRDTSPNIDEFSKSGVLFENCITPASVTQLVIPSLLTSRYITFSARKNYEYVNSLIRLQEILKANGYQTASFIGFNFPFQVLGLEKGFDYSFSQYGLFYEFFIPKAYITFLNAFTKDKHAWEFSFDKMEDELFLWLDKNKENKFFAYVHATDIHSPYRTPGAYRKRFYCGTERDEYLLAEEWRIKQNSISPKKIDYIVDLYDDSIRSMDYNFGKLIEKLKELGIFDRTVFIFVADHGEAFLEHGASHHTRSLFEEEIKVPLIVRYPKLLKENKRIANLVSSLDIMPTTLDILNIEVNEKVDGNSFLPLILKGKEKRKEHREFVFSGKEGSFNCIRTKKWKLIICEESKKSFFGTNSFAHKDVKELYDLENDPFELRNIYHEKSNDRELAELEKKLVNHMTFMKNLADY